MRTFANIISFSLLLLAASYTAAGQGSSNAMSFIDNALSPRAAAMGGVSAGIGSDAYAQFGNIAAIPFSDQTCGVGLSYNGWQPDAADSKTGMLGVTYKIGSRFGVSAGASASFNKSYQMTDEYGSVSGQFTPKAWRVGAGVSYLFTDDFSAGLGLNYASNSLSPYSSALYTFYADIQLIYTVKQVSISLSGHNLGTPVTSASGTKYNIPMNGELAVSYSNVWGKHGLAAGVDGRLYFAGAAACCSAGAEYEYDSLVAVRAGYHYGNGEAGLPSFASVGAGVHVFGVDINAAYLIAAGDSPMRNTFSVGIGYSF